MNITQEQYERINSFLDAEMSVEEMQQFEQELLQYPEMRQHLDFELQMREILLKEPAEDDSLYDRKQHFKKNTKKTKTSTKKIIWFSIAVAASIAAIILLVLPKQGNTDLKNPILSSRIDSPQINKPNEVPIIKEKGLGTLPKKPLNTDSLFNVYFEKDDIPEVPPIAIADELTKYQSGNYDAILKVDLENAVNVRSLSYDSSTLGLGLYYKGIAFLIKNNLQEAIRNLKLAEKIGTDKKYKEKITWYLALAYLKNKELELSIQILKDNTSNQFNKSNNVKLLKNLNSNKIN